MNVSSKIGITILLLGLLVTLFLVNYLPKINLALRNPEAAALVSFPKDHKSHPNFKAEWWYLSLLTKTVKPDGTDEKDTAQVISFSRILNNSALLTSSYDNSNQSFREKTNRNGELQAYLTNNKYLFVQYIDSVSNATLQEKPPGKDRKRLYKLSGKSDEIGSFDLTLKERTVIASGYNKPLLWGGNNGDCKGKISVFAPNDTFYYSIPNLDITGTITDQEGITRSVKIGKAWIDHQWFNSTPPSNWKGHYWTNFHFTHSNNLYNTSPHQAVGFVTQIYEDGPKYTYWVKRDPDGTNQCGENAEVSINNYGQTNYPNSWKIKLKKAGNTFLEATGNAFSDNQIVTPPIGPQFVETASYYSGKINGKNFTGLGFFETHITN